MAFDVDVLRQIDSSRQEHTTSMPPKILPKLTSNSLPTSDNVSIPKKRAAPTPVGRKITLGKCTSCVNDHKKVPLMLAFKAKFHSANMKRVLKYVTRVTPNASHA
jgi:hypothetical protein